MIRETLYEDLPTALRIDLHRRIGEALEDTYRSNLEPHLAQLAHHFSCAAPGGDVDKAIDYAAGAGRRALAQLAYEDAAGWYEQALKMWDVATPSEAQRCELLLALGDAQRRAGDNAAARAAFLEAARSARRLNAPTQLGRAALGVKAAGAETGVVDEPLVWLLEEGLRGLRFGAADTDLNGLFPTLASFSGRDLGLMS